MTRIAFGIAAALAVLSVCPTTVTAQSEILGVRRYTTMHGTLVPGTGLKFDCAQTTAQVRSNGRIIATVPTAPAAGGGCVFSAVVPMGVPLSACPGSFKLADAVSNPVTQNRLDPNRIASSRFLLLSQAERDRSFAEGREQIGTLGSSRILSDVTRVRLIGASQVGNVEIHVTAEP